MAQETIFRMYHNFQKSKEHLLWNKLFYFITIFQNNLHYFDLINRKKYSADRPYDYTILCHMPYPLL